LLTEREAANFCTKCAPAANHRRTGVEPSRISTVRSTQAASECRNQNGSLTADSERLLRRFAAISGELGMESAGLAVSELSRPSNADFRRSDCVIFSALLGDAHRWCSDDDRSSRHRPGSLLRPAAYVKLLARS